MVTSTFPAYRCLKRWLKTYLVQSWTEPLTWTWRAHGVWCGTSLAIGHRVRGVNYSEKSVRRFLGLENPGNFSRDSGIFLPRFKGFLDFFQLIFSKYFPSFFSPNFFRNFLRHIITELYNNWRTCSYTSFSNRSEAKKMADFDVGSRHFHDNWSVILTQLPLTNRDPELQTTFSPPWFWHCF
jgi:hypothetical protein